MTLRLWKISILIFHRWISQRLTWRRKFLICVSRKRVSLVSSNVESVILIILLRDPNKNELMMREHIPLSLATTVERSIGSGINHILYLIILIIRENNYLSSDFIRFLFF